MGSGLSEQTAATRGIRHYSLNAVSEPDANSLPLVEETGFAIIRPGAGITSPYSALARELDISSPTHDLQEEALANLGPKGAMTLDLKSASWEATLMKVAERISSHVSVSGGIPYAVEYAVSESLRNAQEYGGSLDGISRLARVVWNVEGSSPIIAISNDGSVLFNPVKYLNRSIEELLSDVEQCATVNTHVFLQSLACSAGHLEFTWESPSRREIIQCTLQKLSNDKEAEEIPFRLVVAYIKDGFPQMDFNLFQHLESCKTPPTYEKFSIGIAF